MTTQIAARVSAPPGVRREYRLMGPTLTSAASPPRLRMQSSSAVCTAIGVDERDQWLKCMSQAMEEEGVEAELQRALAKAFFGTADWMRNRPEQ